MRKCLVSKQGRLPSYPITYPILHNLAAMSDEKILSNASSPLSTALHTTVLEANSRSTDGNVASSISDADQPRGLEVEQSG